MVHRIYQIRSENPHKNFPPPIIMNAIGQGITSSPNNYSIFFYGRTRKSRFCLSQLISGIQTFVQPATIYFFKPSFHGVTHNLPPINSRHKRVHTTPTATLGEYKYNHTPRPSLCFPQTPTSLTPLYPNKYTQVYIRVSYSKTSRQKYADFR